jgi:hypothetical protein
VPGFNQQQLAYSVQNGNSVTILLGDAPIAFGQTIGHSNDYGTEGLYGVGTAKPQEIQQLKIAPNVSIDRFVLTQAGIAKYGNNVPLTSILANNQFSISVVDGVAGITLYTYVGAVATRYSDSIGSNRPITETIDFLALDVLDQTGQSIMEGPNALTTVGVAASLVNGGLGVQVSGSGVGVSGGASISV